VTEPILWPGGTFLTLGGGTTAKAFEPQPPTPGLREFVVERHVHVGVGVEVFELPPGTTLHWDDAANKVVLIYDAADESFVVDDTPSGVNPLTPGDGDRRGVARE
jgi:hypothetical protein